MRVLHLDDDDLRHELFMEWHAHAGDTSVAVHDLDEFAAAINRERFDIVYLDHDLNDFQYTSGFADMYGWKQQNGVDAATLLATLPEDQRPATVVIHSWNPEGAKRMARVLEEAGFENVIIEEFPQESYFERLVKWKQENKNHIYLDFCDPEKKLEQFRTGR